MKTGAENYILGRFPAKIAIQPSTRSKIVAAPNTQSKERGVCCTVRDLECVAL